jgi:alginate O-acetyltransferase complex protein AlgJ
MVTKAQSVPTRESIALVEVGHTDVSAGVVRFLLIFFLLTVAAVPMYEMVRGGIAAKSGGTAPWEHLTRLPEEIGAGVVSAQGDGPWRELMVGNRILVQALVAFEDALEDSSQIGRLLRPPTQLFLSRWLGAGNERAYTGRDRWLFYRPDVEYVTGAGFLDARYMARRVAKTDQWATPPQPDPRKAILALKHQLDARSIALVLVPTPVKPVVHPERLAWRRGSNLHVPLQNASFASFVEDLRRNGVLVFDPAESIAGAARGSQTTQYLGTDTHWRPETMEAVAGELAAFVRQHVTLPASSVDYRVEPKEIRQYGDIAIMLDLPRTQTLYPMESVTIRRVLSPDGTPWRPSREADVLVLGDSFSNMFSLASMGWGDSAGLVEHVSLALQRPVDRIVQNDQGSYATRELLRQSRADRLAAKRVVIYQFATRELQFGDWKIFVVRP